MFNDSAMNSLAQLYFVDLVGASGAIFGLMGALAVVVGTRAAMGEEQFFAWGWRIPFALGAVLALVVFRIRRGLAETESFASARAADPLLASTSSYSLCG